MIRSIFILGFMLVVLISACSAPPAPAGDLGDEKLINVAVYRSPT